MGMDAVVHGDLPGHQHIVQSLRAMSGISKIFPGREMLPVQYQQIGSQTLGDKAPVGQSQGAGRIAGKLAYRLFYGSALVPLRLQKHGHPLVCGGRAALQRQVALGQGRVVVQGPGIQTNGGLRSGHKGVPVGGMFRTAPQGNHSGVGVFGQHIQQQLQAVCPLRCLSNRFAYTACPLHTGKPVAGVPGWVGLRIKAGKDPLRRMASGPDLLNNLPPKVRQVNAREKAAQPPHRST